MICPSSFTELSQLPGHELIHSLLSLFLLTSIHTRVTQVILFIPPQCGRTCSSAPDNGLQAGSPGHTGPHTALNLTEVSTQFDALCAKHVASHCHCSLEQTQSCWPIFSHSHKMCTIRRTQSITTCVKR